VAERDPRWVKRKEEARIPPAVRAELAEAQANASDPAWKDARWAKLEADGVIGGVPDMIVDIEAVVDTGCPPPKPKEGKEASDFPAPGHWQVVTIGCAWVVNHKIRKLGVIQGETEEEKLRAFVKIFEPAAEETRLPRVVGWSSRRYDLPVIAHRCMRYGIPWPWYYCETRGKNPRFRFSFERQLDLMDVLSDHGSSRASQLDGIARLMGLPGKLETSGADVAMLHAQGLQKQIDLYCLQDVAQTAAVFLRFELLRGKITLVEYQAAMLAWLEVVENTPGAADLLADSRGVAPAGLDLTRLMLDGP